MKISEIMCDYNLSDPIEHGKMVWFSYYPELVYDSCFERETVSEVVANVHKYLESKERPNYKVCLFDDYDIDADKRKVIIEVSNGIY